MMREGQRLGCGVEGLFVGHRFEGKKKTEVRGFRMQPEAHTHKCRISVREAFRSYHGGRKVNRAYGKD